MMKKAVILFMALAVLSACEKKQEKTAKPAPFVELGDAVSKTVPYVIKTIGNTQAYRTVDIQPQVGGELTAYYFTDGQDVAEGDLLFTIDPDLYKAELEQARGEHLQAKAQLKYSQEKLERYTPLVPEDYVSALDFDQFTSNVEEAKGEVLSTKGSVDKAKVNLGYATITAPFGGRCGRHLVDPGNIVHPEEKKPLVTINQITPIYAMISIPERYFSEIVKYNQKSKEGLDVEISVIGNEKVKHRGRLDFIDNTVNPKSGTLTVRAVIPNENKSLWPGQFLHAGIELYMIENAVLVPSEAVGLDTEGHYIFVADEDKKTVELRRVELGQIWKKQQVVMKGVKAGEKVVINGQLALTPGSKYRLKKTEAKAS